MKNKRGFTLVELLAVLLILGTLIAIAVPSIITMSSRFQNKGLDSKISLIEEAAVIYAQSNSNSIKTFLGGKCTANSSVCECEKAGDCKYIYKITLDELIEKGGYTTEKSSESTSVCDVTHPSDSSYCLDCGTITIKLDDNFKTATAEYTLPTDSTKTYCK